MKARQQYARLREQGRPGWEALRDARIAEAFEAAGNLVKLEAEPEIDYYDDSYIDTWKMSESSKAKEKANVARRIDREGHWILVAYFRPTEDHEWIPVDSVGGFIGDDYEDSVYDTDLKFLALEALETHRAEQASQIEAVATYAGV